MSDFVHLRTYTEYSLLYSAARIKDLAKYATQQGMHALGTADFAMYGTISIYETLQQYGLKHVLGQSVFAVHQRHARQQPVELLLIAKDFTGYQSLCTLASLASTQQGNDGQIVNTWKEVAQHHQGLLCLTGGLFGPVHTAFLKDTSQAVRAVKQLQEWFGKDDVYVELQHRGQPEDEVFIEAHARIAFKAQAATVATSPVRHLHMDDVRLLDVLQAIKHGTTMVQEAQERQGLTSEFRDTTTMQSLFALYPEALQATMEITEKTQLEIPLHELSLPEFPLPKGQTEHQMLRDLAYAGLRERTLAQKPLYEKRLQHELGVIERLGFAGYFLIVWDFIRFSRENGISVGPGRGSAAGSLVAYTLFITDVDPVRYGLLFERFLNPERVNWPDIDVDFETERRYEVIRYVTLRYGEQHVAQIGTLGTLATRAAIRDVARVLELSTTETNTIIDALDDDDKLQKLVHTSPNARRTVALSQGIEGLPRHTSTHAAGVVISRAPLPSLAPVAQGIEGVFVTQYSMEDIEALGLLKMDFLGLRTLTICDRARRYVEQTRNIVIGYDAIEMDGPTSNLLSDGDTDGCFQLESSGVKQVLRDLKPTELEDLIAVISLYRPGPMEQISTFIKARRGEIPVRYDVLQLEPILRSTYGIIVYQEQIMQIAHIMAGFTLGQADVLRRAVGKKKREVLDEARTTFVAGCLQNGFSDAVANQVYDLIVRFADYGFNRSHAAAYAVLALRTAYLKAHFRPEFMAALITDSFSRPDKVAHYVSSCRQAGIPVLLPDINQSVSDCTAQRLENGDIAIRFGLSAIKNVGVNAVEAILKDRDEQGPYRSLADLYHRLDARALTKRVLESLIQAGALDSITKSRKGMLMLLDTLVQTPRDGSQLSLLPASDTLQQDAIMATAFALPDDEQEIESWERDLVGVVLSRDPFTDVRGVQKALGVMPIAATLAKWNQDGHLVNHVVDIVAMVSQWRTVRTKKGEMMAFLTVEDGSGKMEIVLFPSVYRLVKDIPQLHQIVRLDVRKDLHVDRHFIAIKIKDMSENREMKRRRRIYIKIDERLEHDRDALLRLRRQLLQHQGTDEVVLIYATGARRLLDRVNVVISDDLLAEIERIAGPDSTRIAEATNQSVEKS